MVRNRNLDLERRRLSHPLQQLQLQLQLQVQLLRLQHNRPIQRNQATSNARKKDSLAIHRTAGNYAASNECLLMYIIDKWIFYSKFYRCVSNGNNGFTKYEFQCGPGTVWDQEIQGCNYADAVKNCGGSQVSSDTSSSQWQTSNSNSQSSSSSSSSQQQSQSQSSNSQSQQSSSSSQSSSRFV